MFKTICVAVDGSNSSLKGVEAACEIAKSFESRLILLHVIRDMKVPSELKRYISSEKLGEPRHAALQEVADEILARAQQVAEESGAQNIQIKTLNGDPAMTLVRGARAEGADLIVLGTRGLGKVEGMLIGSVSRKVTDISEISLMIIK